MLIASILLALLVGWLRGGKVSRLVDFQLKLPWLIIAAFVIQSALPRLTSGPLAGYRFVLLITSYLMLLWALSRNEPNLGIIMTTLGVFLNFTVILLNGGMPVSQGAARSTGYTGSFEALAAAKDGVHVLLGPGSRLAWLADIIPQPVPPFLGAVVSVGDIILAAGVFIVVQNNMKYVGRRRQAEGNSQWQ